MKLRSTIKFDVADKVVLITGGAQGIGLATAVNMRKRGARIALLDVNQDTVNQSVSILGATNTLALVGDVRDAKGMVDAVDKVVAHFGRLDIVVANAGVSPPTATLRTVDPDAFERVIAINQMGTWNTVRPALEQIVANQGHIVVVSSVASFAPGMGGASYMMSKAAVEQLGRALRIELAAHGASAGVAYFGIVDTAMAHGTLDDDPLGAEIDKLLPWPLNRRIGVDAAGTVIADGIERRAARTMAPVAWTGYSLFRGALNVIIDHRLAGNARVHELLKQVESRTLTDRGPMS